MTPPSGPNNVEAADNPSICENLALILSELKLMRAAFPEDEYGEVDVAGHRRYHEAKIAAAKAEAEFWQELKLDVAKKGAWFLLTVLLGLVFVGLMTKLHLSVVK